MQNPYQPAAAPDPFSRALAELQAALAELRAPDESANALAGMRPAAQPQPMGANALAPMVKGAAGYHGGAR